jgi:hypothetical protein
MADTGKAYLGNVSVTVKTPDLTITGREQLREFRRQMRVVHEKGIIEGRLILRDILSAPKYYDTGTLMESVASRLFIKTTDVFEGSVHFNEPGREYAYFVDKGRRKGYPPPASKMLAWGRRKGLSYEEVMKIRNHIAYHGTKARPFFDKAQRRIQANYKKLVDKAITRFRKRV